MDGGGERDSCSSPPKKSITLKIASADSNCGIFYCIVLVWEYDKATQMQALPCCVVDWTGEMSSDSHSSMKLTHCVALGKSYNYKAEIISTRWLGGDHEVG